MKPNETELREKLNKYSAFLETDPGNLALLAESADISLALGEFQRAAGYIDSALKLFPDDNYFVARKASVCIAEGNYAEAVSLLQAIVGAGNKMPAVHYNLAFALAQLGAFAEAARHLAAIVENLEEIQGATALYMRVLHHLGQVEDAIAIGENYMQCASSDMTVPGLLAVLHHDANHTAEAALWAKRALADNPDNPEGQYTAGALALEKEDADGAVNFFQGALRVNSGSGRAWLGLGLGKLLSMNVNDAQANFQNAVKFMPNHIGTWHALAWSQILSKDLVGARDSFSKAMDLDRNFGETHGGLAVLDAMEGHLDAAKEGAMRAIKLQSDSFSGRFALLLIRQTGGKTMDMTSTITRILSAHAAPGGGNLHDMLNRVALKSVDRKNKAN